MALATGLVIGIGGTGANVLSRLQAFVEGERPDAAVKSHLEFLEIDALELDQQPEKVAAAAGLRPEQYFNVIPPAGFEPVSILDMNKPRDPYLQNWWADDYRPETGQVVQALKASRRLGRLAFYNRKAELTKRIRNAMVAAQEIETANVASGGAAGPGGGHELRVFVVASSVGGTGSSGFLEVIHSIYAASRLVGAPTMKIYAVVYLPGVYRGVASSGPMAQRQVQQHNANAFAFFREVDHYLLESGQFYAEFDQNIAGMRVDQPEANNRLIHQLFLIDSTIGGVGSVVAVDDIYDITAEALYQLIMTRTGIPMLGTQGTNYDEVFRGRDVYRKPLAYCSLGASTVLFPGDTYRAYLANRYKDHLVRSLLIPNAKIEQAVKPAEQKVDDTKAGQDNLDQLARADRGALATDIFAAVRTQLLNRVDSSVVLMAEARTLQAVATSATGTLESRPDIATAERLMGEIQRLADSGELSGQLRGLYFGAVDAISPQIDRVILEPLLAAGETIPFMTRTLMRLRKMVSDMKDTETKTRNNTNASMAMVFDTNGVIGADLQDKLDQLRRAQHVGILARAFGGGEDRKQAAATNVGAALSTYASGILAEAALAGRIEMADRIIDRIDMFQAWSERAEAGLVKYSQDLRRLWQDDNLKGKDKGPKATQVLVPSDINKEKCEVEETALAVRAWEETVADFTRSYLGPDRGKLVAEIYQGIAETVPGGVLAMGAKDGEIRARTRLLLDRRLDELAAKFALLDRDGNSRFPTELASAASATGDDEALERALKGMAELARGAYWKYDPSKATYTGGGQPEAPVPNFVATGAARSTLAPWVPNKDLLLEGADPERATAVVIQYAVPVHALTEVPVWERDYEVVVDALGRGDDGYKPPHISSEFETVLEPLVPEYFRRNEVCALVAQAFVLEGLMGATEARPVLSPALARGGIRPLDTSDWPTSFQLHQLVFNKERKLLDSVGGATGVSHEVSSLVTAVGERVQIAAGIKLAWSEIGRLVAPEAVRDAIDQVTGRMQLIEQDAERNRDLDSLADLDEIEIALETLRSKAEMAVQRRAGGLGGGTSR